MEEAEIKICEVSGEEVDIKVRLDVLKKEEQMIAEENEELLQEEEEKKRKVCTLIICTQVYCFMQISRPSYHRTFDNCGVCCTTIAISTTTLAPPLFAPTNHNTCNYHIGTST